MHELEIRFFGEPSIVFSGAPWPLRGAQPRCEELLALLALDPLRPHSRESLGAQLWPEADKAEARANVRRHLSGLLRALPPANEPWILAERDALTWNGGDRAFIDIVAFEALSADPSGYADAVALYRGAFMTNSLEDWSISVRERFRASVVHMSQTLGLEAMRAGDAVTAREYAQKALDLGDWREDSLRLVMNALYALGDRTGALAAYDRFAETLRDEMNVEPMPETIALRAAIFANAPLAMPQLASREQRAGAPFVGRDEQLRALRSAWDRTKRQAGTTIFLGGEAGIGKTRLTRAFAAIVEEDGGRVLWGSSSPDASLAYQPLIDAVKGALPFVDREEMDAPWLATLETAVPEIAALRDGSSARGTVERMNAPARLHDAFVRAFESTARRIPLLLVIEDVHWADAETLDALAAIARRIRGARVLVLVTHRSEETPLGHPLRAVRRALLGEHRASMIALGPLPAAAVHDLVARISGIDDEALAVRIGTSSHGNPLFVVQLASAARAGETLAAEPGLRESVVARVRALDDTARTLVGIGALIDEHFTLEELAEIAASDEASTHAAVDRLLDAHLLRWTSEPGFSLTFAHQLLRDAVLDGVPARGRKVLHGRIGRVLETTRADRQAWPVIARHFELAGELPRAFERYLALASSSIAVFAPAHTLDVAHHALRVASNDRERFDALRIAIDAHAALGIASASYRDDVEAIVRAAESLDERERFLAARARAYFCISAADVPPLIEATRELVAHAERAGTPEMRFAAYAALGQSYMLRGEMEKMREALEHALSFVEEETPDTFNARCSLMTAYARLGQRERAIALFAELERLSERFTEAAVQLWLGTAQQILAVVYERIEYFEAAGRRLVNGGERSGAVIPRIIGLSLLSHAAYRRGDVAEGRALRDRLNDLASDPAILLNRLAIRLNVMLPERELGNLDAAIAVWTETLEEGRRRRLASAIICSLVNIAGAILERAEYERARDLAREALDLVREHGEVRLFPDASAPYGVALCGLGATDEGLDALRAAAAKGEELGAIRSLSENLRLLVEALLSAGRIDEAKAYADRLHELRAEGRELIMHPARVCAVLALVADATGDVAAARRLRFEGEAIVRVMLERIPDEETRKNYEALSHHGALLARKFELAR